MTMLGGLICLSTTSESTEVQVFAKISLHPPRAHPRVDVTPIECHPHSWPRRRCALEYSGDGVPWQPQSASLLQAAPVIALPKRQQQHELTPTFSARWHARLCSSARRARAPAPRCELKSRGYGVERQTRDAACL